MLFTRVFGTCRTTQFRYNSISLLSHSAPLAFLDWPKCKTNSGYLLGSKQWVFNASRCTAPSWPCRGLAQMNMGLGWGLVWADLAELLILALPFELFASSRSHSTNDVQSECGYMKPKSDVSTRSKRNLVANRRFHFMHMWKVAHDDEAAAVRQFRSLGTSRRLANVAMMAFFWYQHHTPRIASKSRGMCKSG